MDCAGQAALGRRGPLRNAATPQAAGILKGSGLIRCLLAGIWPGIGIDGTQWGKRHMSWGTLTTMDLTRPQMTFLADLRKGTCRATSAQDACVIGPLIRANLVRWDVDPGEAASRREPPGTTFTLTPLGEAWLAAHEAQERVATGRL